MHAALTCVGRQSSTCVCLSGYGGWRLQGDDVKGVGVVWARVCAHFPFHTPSFPALCAPPPLPRPAATVSSGSDAASSAVVAGSTSVPAGPPGVGAGAGAGGGAGTTSSTGMGGNVMILVARANNLENKDTISGYHRCSPCFHPPYPPVLLLCNAVPCGLVSSEHEHVPCRPACLCCPTPPK